MSKPRTCRVVRSARNYRGKQGLEYGEAISKETVGSEGICMHLLTIPPGSRAKAHLHENHETAIYVLRGKSAMWYGENLMQHMEVEAGDFVFIPAGTPHLPYNPNDTEPCTAIIARTDPNEQESVVLLPQLDDIWDRNELD